MRTIGDIASNICNTVLHIESPIEQLLLSKMIRDLRFTLVNEGEPDGEGLFIYPQMQIGPYRADLLIKGRGYHTVSRVWPPKATGILAVECDGKGFHTSPEQVEHDQKRDEYFKSKGIKTIRFTGAEINRDVSFCIDCIAHEINQLMGIA